MNKKITFILLCLIIATVAQAQEDRNKNILKSLTIGLEYRLSSVIGLSVDAGLVGGEIGKPKVDNDELQAAVNELYTGKMDASRLYLPQMGRG